MFSTKIKHVFAIMMLLITGTSCGNIITWPLSTDKRRLPFSCLESTDTITSIKKNVLISEVYEWGERVADSIEYSVDNEEVTGIGGDWLAAFEGWKIGLSGHTVIVRVRENLDYKERHGMIILRDPACKEYISINITQAGRPE